MTQRRLAIVGIAFRFPGPEGEGFWQALCEGRDLVGSVDGSRWPHEAFFHPRESEPGCTYTNSAGSLGDVSGFDAAFFNISPREAAQMDPQQRLLLELTWEALESGGIRPSTIRGSRCAVVVGFSGSDYLYRHADDLASLDSFVMTGCTASVAANRISYFFDFRGPSMAIDTACSSSLVALHQACQSLLSGESDLAVTGAVNLHLHPLPFIAFSKAAMLSKKGTCSPFDAAGDGYVRSEGGAIVVLKRLEDALTSGNRIYAVVAGSAVNCDGKTSGLTVPSAEAQTALLEEAYARAGIDPAEVDYVEAHGTGTAVGDPIEARALGLALGKWRTPGSRLRIGSVKSNIGHLEAAAGMAGLVKAIYCLRHRLIPATLHFATPNPRIAFEEWNLEVVSAPVPLDQNKKLVIGVNSFGFGGANAHVILESAPALNGTEPRGPDRAAPLVVSGRTDMALKASAGQLAAWIRERTDLPLYDIAYSAAMHRDWHEYRAIVYGADRESAVAALEALAEGGQSEHGASGRALARPFGPAFIYSGNGSQWAGMGRRLLDEDVGFRESVEAVDRLFRHHWKHSVIELLRREDLAQWLESTSIAQPLLFAIQVGITTMLQAWGIAPVAAAGHSVGEIAAAWACGALSLEQAVHVVYHRSVWQETTKGAGTMYAVRAGEHEILEILACAGGASRVTVAAVNSPRSVTLAGTQADLEALEAVLKARDLGYSRLPLAYAFHSATMDSIKSGITASLGNLRPNAAAIPFFSTVTGKPLVGEALDGSYWWRNIREPVRFDRAIEGLHNSGVSVFVEIGPRPILTNYVRECLGDAAGDCRILATMAPTADGLSALRRRAYEVLVSGCRTDLAKLFPVAVPYTDIPAYPWQRERHWYEPTAESLSLLGRRPVHRLLGYSLQRGEPHWENRLDTVRYPELADHQIGSEAVFPASGFVELALGAAGAIQAGEAYEVEDLAIQSALVLGGHRSRTVRLRVDPETGRFTICSRETLSDETWRLNASGRLLPGAAAGPAPALLELSIPHSRVHASAEEHYAMLEEIGLRYGPAFRTVTDVWLDAEGVTGVLAPPEPRDSAATGWLLDPRSLDGCLQLLVHLLRDWADTSEGVAFLPVRFGRVSLFRPAATIRYARMRATRRGPRSMLVDCTLYGEDRASIASLREVRFRAVSLQESTAGNLVRLVSHAIPMPLVKRSDQASLPSAECLRTACTARLHARERQEARRRYHTFVEPLLEALFCAFAKEALCRLSGNGTLRDADDLVAQGAVPAARKAQLARLIEVAADTEFPQAQDIWLQLLGDHPDHSQEILALGRIGMHLADLLDGRTQVEKLVCQRDCPVAEAWLEPSLPAAADFAQAAAELAAAALAALPTGERLRVLCIEAASLNFAACVLSVLDRERSDCTVACSSALAYDKSATLKARYPWMSLVKLDLAQPDAQLDPDSTGTFDLILVNGAAIAARDRPALLQTITRVAKRGALLLVFQPQLSRAMSYAAEIFCDELAEARTDSPERRAETLEGWRAALKEYGFAPGALVEDVVGLEAGPFLLMAHAAAGDSARVARAQQKTAGARHWLLVLDPGGWSDELAERLAGELLRRGQRVRKVKRDLSSPTAWKETLDAVRIESGEIDGIVELPNLPPAPASRPPRDLMEHQIRRCELLGKLFESCATDESSATIWIVTLRSAVSLLPAAAQRRSGAEVSADDAPCWGFVRSAMNEYPQLSLRLVDLAFPDAPGPMAAALADTLVHPDVEDEVILTPSGRYAVRVEVAPISGAVPATSAEHSLIRLEPPVSGQIKTLRWSRDHLRIPSGDEVEIEVRAAGLNFRDVMFAMGQLDDEALESGFSGPTLGMEVSGVVVATGPLVHDLVPGDEVIAFAPAGLATRVLTKASAVLRKPSAWTFEAAATVPTAFFTAHYALNHLARLAEGERVLIHGAAGGVGIAAVLLAQLAGAEVFATAGSEEKRDFLRLLGVDHVLNSRTLEFADQVMALTGGEGVDVVLNSLAGEAMIRSLRVLRPLGRFLELGKRDFYNDTQIGLRPFRKNVTYFGIDADQLMHERPAFTRRLMLDLMARFEEGTLKPLPFRVFAAEDVVEAFRYMQQSRHIGKIVLRMDPPPMAHSARRTPRAKLRLRAEATYLVTGGLGGFGLRTAEWLAEKGARHLVLVGRRGVTDPETHAVIAALEARGVEVRAARCDVTDYVSLQQLLASIQDSMPPLRGVIHAAAVFQDRVIRNLQHEDFVAVFAPKVLGALNLHRLTRDRELDFFVLYSSAATFGNPGQANYVAANRFLEILAESRRASGLPGLCVSWGPIDEVGYLARNKEIKDRVLARTGEHAIPPKRALQALEQMMLEGESGGAVIPLSRGAARFLFSTRSPKFQPLLEHSGEAAPIASSDAEFERLLVELDDEGLAALLTDMLKKEVADILRLPSEKLDASTPLQDLGLDSLMGVELMTAIEVRFGISIPVVALSDIGTTERLARRLVKELRRGRAAPQHDAEAMLREQVRSVAAQHSREISPDEIEALAADLQRQSAESREPVRQ